MQPSDDAPLHCGPWRFAALAAAAGVPFALGIAGLGLAALPGLETVLPAFVRWVILAVTGIAAAAVLLSVALTMFAAGHSPLFPKLSRWMTLKVALPLTLFLCRRLGIDRDCPTQGFVAVHNTLVTTALRPAANPRALVLLPHCVQLEDCELKLTKTIYTCKECGACDIAGLIDIARGYEIDIAVATGGTVARRIVAESRPDMIVAIACERDLLAGIRDTYPLPVIGILNQRPNGPCRDTRVDCGIVRDAIHGYMQTIPDAYKEEP